MLKGREQCKVKLTNKKMNNQDISSEVEPETEVSGALRELQDAVALLVPIYNGLEKKLADVLVVDCIQETNSQSTPSKYQTILAQKIEKQSSAIIQGARLIGDLCARIQL